MKSISMVPLLIYFLCGCEENKKISVLRVTDNKGNKLHWYVYSRPTTYSQSYVEYIWENSSESVMLLKSHYLSNVSFTGKDTILIQCHTSDYELLNHSIDGYTVSVDTFGSSRNRAEFRINHPNFKFYVPGQKEFWQ